MSSRLPVKRITFWLNLVQYCSCYPPLLSSPPLSSPPLSPFSCGEFGVRGLVGFSFILPDGRNPPGRKGLRENLDNPNLKKEPPPPPRLRGGRRPRASPLPRGLPSALTAASRIPIFNRRRAHGHVSAGAWWGGPGGARRGEREPAAEPEPGGRGDAGLELGARVRVRRGCGPPRGPGSVPRGADSSQAAASRAEGRRRPFAPWRGVAGRGELSGGRGAREPGGWAGRRAGSPPRVAPLVAWTRLAQHPAR